MKFKKIFTKIIIFITIMMFFLKKWMFSYYGRIGFDQILFHIVNPIQGVEKSIIFSFVDECLILTILYYIIILSTIKLVSIINKVNIIELKNTLLITIFVFSSIFIYFLYDLGAVEYMLLTNKNSDFIQENYVEPEKVKLTFPKKKRNLIYIFVESLESTYLSKDLGGELKENLIPELYELSKDNVSFSDKKLLGGGYEINGTTWTTAGLVSQTSGVVIKMPVSWAHKPNTKNFIGGAYAIGNILQNEGYNQTIMLGSSAEFGNINTYIENHGNYKIYDYNSAIANKKIDDDYFVWWGYEDSKLFEYAKEELVDLYKKDEPFNLTLFTINTHFPDGYLEEECEKRYKDNYSNVIACTSKQLYNFVLWCKEQEFYENTTIVIVGDHLSMDPNFFKEIDKKDRRIFNLFINANISNDDFDYNNREFSSLDMYPTTLASLGVTIEGNKLGLGTNLFSKEKTLIEKYGLEEVNKQLSYKSDFYNKNIFCYK